MDELTIISNYKTDERHARQLAANGLDLLLKSISEREALAAAAEYSQYWADQNAKLPPGADAALGQMESLVGQLHLLMWQLHTGYNAANPGGNLFPGITEPDPE